jgi:DNA-binding NarL/FixJ family response regulator
MSKTRVFLADDHAVVREGLKGMVASQLDMEVVGEADDGAVACDRARALLPDVMVMDVTMPGLNGLQATEKISRECPGVRVLALTVHEDNAYLHQILAAGAVGYVLKRAAPDELVRAIRIVAAGGVYLDPTMAGKLVSGISRRPSPTDPLPTTVELSARETEIVRLTAAGYGNKEIASQLDISVKTVETYRSRAMEKLDIHGRAELVRYVIRRGWLQDI